MKEMNIVGAINILIHRQKTEVLFDDATWLLSGFCANNFLDWEVLKQIIRAFTFLYKNTTQFDIKTSIVVCVTRLSCIQLPLELLDSGLCEAVIQDLE